jgi:P-type Ca2+ transporter type 2C
MMASQEPYKLVAWHAKTIPEVCKELGFDETLPTKGLTTEQATTRLTQFGYNKLTEKERKTLLQRIWAQLANVLVFVLVVVAAVAASQAATAQGNSTKLVTNIIQVALIIFVIV